jgi:hypothetical protein
VILPRQGGYAQTSQFVYGRRGPLRVSRGVPNHQLEWPAGDPAGLIDFANSQLESGEQVLACLDPARPGERNESADVSPAASVPDITSTTLAKQATDYLFAESARRRLR